MSLVLCMLYQSSVQANLIYSMALVDSAPKGPYLAIPYRELTQPCSSPYQHSAEAVSLAEQPKVVFLRPIRMPSSSADWRLNPSSRDTAATLLKP